MTTRPHYHRTLYKVLCKWSETFNQWLCFYDNQLETRLIWDPAYLWYCTGWSQSNDRKKQKCHTQYLNYKLGDFFSYSHGFKRIDQGHRFGLFLRLWWVCSIIWFRCSGWGAEVQLRGQGGFVMFDSIHQVHNFMQTCKPKRWSIGGCVWTGTDRGCIWMICISWLFMQIKEKRIVDDNVVM